jgi:alpha-beta hydrolase superfamily lysophospholipase
MLNINQIKPLPAISFEKTVLRDCDAEFLEYYGLHFSKTEKAVRHHFGSMDLAGFNIAAHFFSQSKLSPTVLVLHGYTDHVGLYNYLIKRLLDEGFNVLAFDLPGHGLSSGEPAAIGSFQDYQAVLKEFLEKIPQHLRDNLSVVAQSTGGSIVADYLMNNSEQAFKKVVLLSPLVIPKQWNWVKLQLLSIGNWVHEVPRKFNNNCSNTQFLRFVKYNDQLQARTIKASWVKALFEWQQHFNQSPKSAFPCLIVQGDEDKTVEWLYNGKRLSEKFRNASITLIPRAGHHLVKELTVIREKVFDTVCRHLKD